ncbi:MAG TPA: hypothetical protein PK867_27080 [Pirellulales bacterium]|nr:hypothetical protein [Pirellulales bacterium]
MKPSPWANSVNRARDTYPSLVPPTFQRPRNDAEVIAQRIKLDLEGGQAGKPILAQELGRVVEPLDNHLAGWRRRDGECLGVVGADGAGLLRRVERFRAHGQEDGGLPRIGDALGDAERLFLRRGQVVIDVIEEDDNLPPHALLNVRDAGLNMSRAVGEEGFEVDELFSPELIGVGLLQGGGIDAPVESFQLLVVNGSDEASLLDVDVVQITQLLLHDLVDMLGQADAEVRQKVDVDDDRLAQHVSGIQLDEVLHEDGLAYANVAKQKDRAPCNAERQGVRVDA